MIRLHLLACQGVFRIALAAMISLGIWSDWRSAVEAVEVEIRTSFPGGNARILQQSDSEIHIEPDLRGDRPWFYWYFEAIPKEAGRVRFVFPEKVIGFVNGGIGRQGPAISLDSGATWNWMGTDNVQGRAFVYEFAEPSQPIRFAVTIPYVHSDWEKFLASNAGNSHAQRRVLTKSREQRDVDVLRIGQPGPGKYGVLVTGRHHAAETMASFVLEGFLAEAMSESPAGREFRERYVLHAVPIVDRDGVENGDQGKNRQPHDHNRDYGSESIYPEIRAIKELARDESIQFSLDFHCPTLVLDDHQVMHFLGAKNNPPYNYDNVSEYAKWIRAGLPEGAPAGPLVWLKPASEPVPMNSHYFGFRESTIMAATLEFPFAPPGKNNSTEDCRAYGAVLLRAWVQTHFLDAAKPQPE